MTEQSKIKVKFLDGTRKEMSMDSDLARSYQRMNVVHTKSGETVKVRRLRIDEKGVFHFKEEKVVEGNIP